MLVCHQYDVCKNYVGSVYVDGYGGLSESGLCVFVNCVQSAFLWLVGSSVSLYHQTGCFQCSTQIFGLN